MPNMSGGSRTPTRSRQASSKTQSLDRTSAATPTAGEYTVRLPPKNSVQRQPVNVEEIKRKEKLVDSAPVLRTSSPQEKAGSLEVETAKQHVLDDRRDANCILQNTALNIKKQCGSGSSPHLPFLAFGRAAHPTRAKYDDDCQLFLKNRCYRGGYCHRVHPILPSNLPPQESSPPADSKPECPVEEVSNMREIAPVIPEAGAEADPDDSDFQNDSFLFGSAPSSPTPKHFDCLSQSGSENPSEGTLTDSPTSTFSTFDSHPSASTGSTAPSSIMDETDTVTSLQTKKTPVITVIRPYCRDWMLNKCLRGFNCHFYHADLKYNPPVRGVHPRPRFPTICPEWEAGRCMKHWLCHFVHGNLKYDNVDWIDPRRTSSQASTLRSGSIGGLTQLDPSERERCPPPPSFAPIVCRQWLINRCYSPRTCKFVHEDIEYDPPVSNTKYPSPLFKELCMVPECSKGYGCNYTHEDLDYSDCISEAQLPPSAEPGPSVSVYNDPPPGKRPRPPSQNPCLLYSLGQCHQRYRCKYVHDDLEYDPMPSEATSAADEDPPVGRRPLPQIAETCMKWLRDECPLRYACKFRHGDLDYDPLFPPGLKLPSHLAKSMAAQKSSRPPWHLRVRDHARVKIGSGFEVQEITTGFETPWIYMGNVPKDITADEVAKLAGKYGEVLDIKFDSKNPVPTTKVRFSTSAEALEASAQLNGVQAFGTKITARLPISTALRSNATFQDTSVRIRWEAPGRTAYCGYSTREKADKAIFFTRVPFRDNCVTGNIHSGLPVVGIVTVRLRGVPLDVKDGDMERFNHPEDIVWSQPNYRDFNAAVDGIRRMIYTELKPLQFNVLPPPYRKGGIAQAWVHFATPAEAEAACNRINGKKPIFTGKTRITATHVKSLTFNLSPLIYSSLEKDIRALERTVYRSQRSTMNVFQRSPTDPFIVKLAGEDTKELGQLKAEFESILNWELLKVGTRGAYDPYFAHDSGKTFLDALRQKYPEVRIRNDDSRRTIELRGISHARRRVKDQILSKLLELRAQKVRSIALDGPLLGIFLCKFLDQLCNDVGRDNVVMDLLNKTLRIRGDNGIFSVALDAVREAKQSLKGSEQRRYVTQCPVCLDEVTQPVVLPCSHAWCHSCLIRYLVAAIDTKTFPLMCLGKEGKCGEPIPLFLARMHLTQGDFDALVDAAFDDYVHTHPDQFRYCPTPDCSQIYRPGVPETVLQCPSCLLRICPNCHIEAHDGFDCPEKDGGHNLFKEWLKNHDVKPCPGCNVPIERAEGCNHMTCTICKTHICWVCMQTFPGGKGIYDHMRSAHGGIGLPDPFQQYLQGY